MSDVKPGQQSHREKWT